MTQHLSLRCRPEHLEPPKAMPDGDPTVGLEDGPYLEGPASPSLARVVEAPAAVHTEMRMDRDLAVRAHEEVLASRDDLGHDLSAQVGGREARDADVRAREALTRKCLVQTCGRREHRVAFCHPDIIRNRSADDWIRCSATWDSPSVHLPYSGCPFSWRSSCMSDTRRGSP